MRGVQYMGKKEVVHLQTLVDLADGSKVLVESKKEEPFLAKSKFFNLTPS